MTKRMLQQIKDLKELLIFLGIVFTTVSIIGGFAWCKVVIPEMDARIDLKQVPVIKAIKDVSDRVEAVNKTQRFQLYVQTRGMPKNVYDSLNAEFERVF